MANNRHGPARVLLVVAALALYATTAGAVRKSDVLNSKHNLSATAGTAAYAPARTVTAVSETQICVFCHTPHGATTADLGAGAIIGQLWNRRVPATTSYTGYTSSSLDAATIQAGFNGQPGGSSKLCLSCHDGTLSMATVNVINGASGAPGVNIPMTGGITTLPAGTYGASSGYTPVTGADLRNDHPISVDFTRTLADRDGELRPVNNTALQNWQSGGLDIIGKRGPGYRPKLPLEDTGAGGIGQVQCNACHDPHIVETDTTKGNQHFLRTNRFQEATPTGTYSWANDIICLGCHEKNNGAVGVWAYSAHANPLVTTTQTYTAAAVAPRTFPANLPVWKAACLNCHNGHATQGSYHLLAEGTDGPLASGVRQGGNRAQENTCYQCHDGTASVISTALKDIKGDFAQARHKPIATATEVHDIGGNFTDGAFVDCINATNKCGADGIEQRLKLGVGAAANRHVECSDCHNPHRVVKFQKFYGAAGSLSGPVDASATHVHTDTAGYTHDNIASGALRGTWGVEPTYANASFQNLPSGYIVKRGDPGSNAVTTVGQPYVTREYQVCLKCHSDYGYSDNNSYATGGSTSGRPALGSYAGATPSPTNGMTYYTNQAKEFQAPTGHKGEPLSVGTTGGANVNLNNHRSWHPVMDVTGRTQGARGITVAGAFLNPWNFGLGNQTMYCSDCHGSNTTSPTSVIPDATKPWGPHGSTQNFVLKGRWDNVTSAGSYGLCLKCHAAAVYDGPEVDIVNSGFYAPGRGQGHVFHRTQLGGKLRCNWCHVAVPHGWKNKSLLVNLNDVGPEVGLAAGTNVGRGPYTRGPYYMNAYLTINSFKPRGTWSSSKWGGDCDHGHGTPP